MMINPQSHSSNGYESNRLDDSRDVRPSMDLSLVDDESSVESVLPLSADPTFHYELLRVLGTARDRGADVGEVLRAALRVIPGDFDSWHDEFAALAHAVRDDAMAAAARGKRVSARGAYFRAATYFRAADFFLHGNPNDARITTLWRLATSCFDEAISRLDVPAERFVIAADGFTIPAVLYRAGYAGERRPTVLMCNGYDGSQEELLHVSGFAALERGFNVVTFEGPGQPSVLRSQGLGFITEWEEVVSPVMNWCAASRDVDPGRVGLYGYSFGGFLVARAAAFEPRLTAVACVDGIYDAHASFTSSFPRPVAELFEVGAADAFDRAVRVGMAHSTALRWAVEHGGWAFRADGPFEFLTRTRDMTMKDIAHRIQCPVLVCDAENDAFFKGQPVALAKAIGRNATHRVFTRSKAADAHCHVGASDHVNSVVMDWFEDHLAC
jgi:dienelactone hydrolase